MIRLNLKTKPYWMDLGHGVRVKVRPLTPGLFSASQLHAHSEVQKLSAEWDEKNTHKDDPSGPDMSDDNIRAGLISEHMATFLAVNSIIEWQGVMNAKGDEQAPVCRETIFALLQIFWNGQ